MARKGLWLGILMACVLAGSNGCQRRTPFVPVEGIVTHNGQPQARIEVIFLADSDVSASGSRARGQTDAEGRYRLLTENKEIGTTPGSYRVLLVDSNAQKSRVIRDARESTKVAVRRAAPDAARHLEEESNSTVSRVPDRYCSVNDTPLRTQVGAAPLVFDIEIP